MDSSYSVSDLSYQMGNYSIHPRPRYPSSSYHSSTSPSECSSPTAADSTFSNSTFSPIATPASSVASSAPPSRNNTYHTTNVRAQRQRAVRQQCSSGHLSEIADLVSRMVNNGEQCSVCTRPSSPPPSSSTADSSASTTHTPIRLARQNSDSSDGSVSPFSRATFDEDENMADDDEDDQSSAETDSVGTPDYFDMSNAPTFGDWQFSWGTGRSKLGESTTERKGCITKDTRSRKHMRRR